MQALGDIKLVDEVHEPLYIGGCGGLLSIRDLATRDLTLEILSSFDIDRSHADYNRVDMIHFYALGQYHSMSLTEFSDALELYVIDYIYTEEYGQLPFDYPIGVTPSRVFWMLCGNHQYEVGSHLAPSPISQVYSSHSL